MEGIKLELVKWDKLSSEIEQAKDIDQLKQLSDKLEAIRILSKQSKKSLETQNRIATYRLRVERKKGEWLKDNKQKLLSRSTDSTDRIELTKIGITKNESLDAQRIAAIPAKKFESLMQEIKEDGDELTKSFMVNTAKKIERELDVQKQKKDIESGKVILPEGRFEIIVIDPPWEAPVKEYDSDHYMGRTSNPYPEMSLEQIRNIKLPYSDNCVLWLWTTHHYIWDAIEILKGWGFEYKAILVWNKELMGVGKWFRKQCEFCLLGIKGKPIWDTTNTRDIISEARTKHSRKPDIFYKMVEEICIGRKLDYFAREKRNGWEVFGNEIKKENDISL